MKKILIIIIVAAMFSACANSKPATGNTTTASSSNVQKDGSSFEKAIFIDEKKERPGVAEEYKWLKANYPGYKVQGQSLSHNGGKPYDIITITTAEGKTKKIYFDISQFFGKL
jgi:ABC-type glycerol-3-phosphate transport system substrate-binding protein